MGDLDFKQLRAIQEELDPTGESTLPLQGDITDPESCSRWVAEARERFDRIDGLVHVAAVDSVSGGLMDGDLDDWTRVAEVNVRGTLQLTRAAVPLLREGGGGSIVIIGSIADNEVVESFIQLAYGASKAALRNVAYYLSRELGPDGIRVNNIAPGWKWGPTIENGLREAAVAQGMTVSELLSPVREAISLRRFATDDDVAEAISFFCSDRSLAITGQTLYIDGGICH
jgi:NAD(P)-dependent dehydrogenase (short-subunit alcohol dehydrogenase family)